jgi:hypothetical protein
LLEHIHSSWNACMAVPQSPRYDAGVALQYRGRDQES